MTYIKLDDAFHLHPKVVRLSDAAYRLYVGMLCYCSSQLTDGIVPAMAIHSLHQRHRKPLEELQAAGLVDASGDAWAVHDYLQHQRSRAEIELQRDAARVRAKRGRSSREVREPEVRDRVQRQSVTHPVPDRAREDGKPTEASKALDWFRWVCAREPRTGAELQVIDDWDVHGGPCVAWAFTESIGKDAPERYVKRIFDSCAMEGHGPRYVTRAPRTNGGGRGIRSGDGASERRPASPDSGGRRSYTDAEAEQRIEELKRRSAEIKAAGRPAGEVG